MHKRTIRSRLTRLALAAAMTLTVMSGCDPAARDTVLQGVNDAATGLGTSFINAYFETLQEDEPAQLNIV